jgi:hypothetical protein
MADHGVRVPDAVQRATQWSGAPQSRDPACFEPTGVPVLQRITVAMRCARDKSKQR